LKKIIYVKLKLIDKIKNKYNFDKRAKNKKKRIEVETSTTKRTNL
jgi:hypothetical protein